GDVARDIGLASAVVGALASSDIPEDAQSAYFHWATIAEAALVLGDRVMLEGAVDRANPLCRKNLWGGARTFGQMRRLLGARPELVGVVDRWYRPPVGLVLP